MGIRLSNQITIKEPYAGNSKFPFWKNLKVGDVVTISVDLVKTERGGMGRSYNGLKAVRAHLTCGDLNFNCSMNQLVKYLDSVVYHE